jgi:hypothetical protein
MECGVPAKTYPGCKFYFLLLGQVQGQAFLAVASLTLISFLRLSSPEKGREKIL